MLNPRLFTSPEFAFARLAQLLAGLEPATDGFKSYPSPAGTPELRAFLARWAKRRYGVALDAESEIMPVAGTKEALHLLGSVVESDMGGPPPVVLMPNPLYQVYLGDKRCEAGIKGTAVSSSRTCAAFAGSAPPHRQLHTG